MLRVNVGEIHAGTGVNIIAANALMKLEFRGENNNIADYAKKRVLEIIEGSAKTHDVKYKIDDYGQIPTAKSDRESMEIVRKAAEKVDWFENIYEEGNVGGTDDATVMMNRVQEKGGKAVYFGIGADINQPLHNCKFDFDEDALVAGTELCFNILDIINQ